jgi:hypothetical protein
MEPSLLMVGPIWLSVWNVVRNLLGIYVGTAAIVGYAFTPLSLPMRGLMLAAALAILIPANAFPGADLLDWVGLGGAVVLAGFNFLHSRSGRSIVAAQPVAER